MGRLIATVDVRDMTCAQALAVVAKAATGQAGSGALDILYNADDVRRDVEAWGRGRGYRLQAPAPGTLQLRRGTA